MQRGHGTLKLLDLGHSRQQRGWCEKRQEVSRKYSMESL